LVRVTADLHIHSPFSAATSEKMTLHDLVRFSRIKGLNLLGTGDALHPSWLSILKQNLEETVMKGLYKLKGEGEDVLFLTQTEVGTVHVYEGKVRRIHHVILMPSLEVAEQLTDRLSKLTDLKADGRPVLTITPAELVETVIETSSDNFIFPAHAWTPWWSIFGSIGGVNRMEECYEDMTKHIYALETGLSSDPAMNWRLSALDRYTLLSSSDSHSPWPWRLGRECNVFELEEPSYKELIDAIKAKDPSRILFTIETPPEYGKYHYSGHRKCGVGPIPPSEARKIGYRCPVCGKRLTKGVEDRVEEMADRPKGFKPENAIPYIKVLPLAELIATALGVKGEQALYSSRVWDVYLNVVNVCGNELKALIESSREDIEKASTTIVADLVVKARENALKITPGFDGVYGRLQLENERGKPKKQRNLTDFLT